MCVMNVLMRCWRQECVCSECVDKLQATGGCTCYEYVCGRWECMSLCVVNMLTRCR